MIDINPNHISNLKKIFGNNAYIFCLDYLDYNIDNNIKFDFIIANPPYNIGNISFLHLILKVKIILYGLILLRK